MARQQPNCGTTCPLKENTQNESVSLDPLQDFHGSFYIRVQPELRKGQTTSIHSPGLEKGLGRGGGPIAPRGMCVGPPHGP